MISLDRAVIARYAARGLNFEILVEPEKALEFRTGKEMPVDDLVAATEVFSDSAKGIRAAHADLNKAFGTTDFEKILKKIIREGEVQITTEQKRKIQETKRKKIVAAIAKRAIDPRTRLPHPPVRIEKAMAEAKIHVDPFKAVEEQVSESIDKIKRIIPISMEMQKIAVRIPAQHASQAYGILKEYRMTKEEWRSDGSLIALVEVMAGEQSSFYDRINKLTAGQCETKTVDR